QQGSATWDGKGAPVLGTEDEQATARLQDAVAAETGEEPDQIAASLIECVSALREGRTPMCEVHENLLSFAMVEAAVASVERAGRGRRAARAGPARGGRGGGRPRGAGAHAVLELGARSAHGVSVALTPPVPDHPSRPCPTTPPDRARPPDS